MTKTISAQEVFYCTESILTSAIMWSCFFTVPTVTLLNINLGLKGPSFAEGRSNLASVTYQSPACPEKAVNCGELCIKSMRGAVCQRWVDITNFIFTEGGHKSQIFMNTEEVPIPSLLLWFQNDTPFVACLEF